MTPFKDQASWLSRGQVLCKLSLLTWSRMETITACMSLAGDSTGQFAGVVDCFSKTFKREGLSAFYNGFGPNFARLGSWNVVMFLTVEQVKKLFQPKD